MALFDPLQTLISLGGVSLIVGLVWLATRGKPTPLLGGEAGAREMLARELPGFEIAAVVVDPDDRRALAVARDQSEVALLFSMGGHTACWKLSAKALGPMTRRDLPGGRAALGLHTGDFTLPSFSLVQSKPQIDAIATRLRGKTGESS